MTWVLALIIWVEPQSPLEFYIGFETKQDCEYVAENPKLFLKDWAFRDDVEIDAECHFYPNVQLLGLKEATLL